MEPRRVLVVTSPANLPAAARAPLVGLFEFTTPELWCGVVVKSRIGKTGSTTLRRPEFLLATRSQADALGRPTDFVPLKPYVDLVLMGHVRPPKTESKLSAVLHVGASTIPMQLVADADSGRVAFNGGVSLAEAIDTNMRPRNSYDCEATDFKHKADFPWEIAQAAHPHLVFEDLAEATQIRLEAVIGANQRIDLLDVELPSFSPRVIVDPSHSGREVFEVPMRLDTVVLDAGDGEVEVELTWRGMFPSYTGVGDVDRLLLGFATNEAMDTAREGWPFLLRELPYGQFDFAWFFSDAKRGIAPRPLDDDETKAARYRVWNYPASPEPRTSLEDMAAIQARLEQRFEPRAETLRRYGLDEQFYAIEQRAWLEKVAAESRVTGGRPTLSKRFVAARRLATQVASEEPKI